MNKIERAKMQDRLMQFLLEHGFQPCRHIRGLRCQPFETVSKGKVFITFMQFAVRIDVKLDEPIVRRYGWQTFTQTHQRISGCSYSHITFENGRVRGIGFDMHPKLHELVYGCKEKHICG